PAAVMDTAIINSAFKFNVAQIARCQFAGPHSHVLFWHNTGIGQDLSLNVTGGYPYNPTTSCEIYGSAFPLVFWNTSVDDDLLIQYNRWWTGPNPAGDRSSDNNVLGDPATDVPGADAGDFTPAATLLTDLVPRRVPFDMLGNPRNAMTAKGAVEVPA